MSVISAEVTVISSKMETKGELFSEIISAWMFIKAWYYQLIRWDASKKSVVDWKFVYIYVSFKLILEHRIVYECAWKLRRYCWYRSLWNYVSFLDFQYNDVIGWQLCIGWKYLLLGSSSSKSNWKRWWWSRSIRWRKRRWRRSSSIFRSVDSLTLTNWCYQRAQFWKFLEQPPGPWTNNAGSACFRGIMHENGVQDNTPQAVF